MNGVVRAVGAADQHMAWVGVEVSAAIDLTRLSGYAELPEPQRQAQAHQADTAYLSRVCSLPPGTAIDYRWLADGLGSPRLSILARSDAQTARQAEAAALAVRDRLADLPDHVVGGPITDNDLLHYMFRPFNPGPAGVIQIRRQPITSQPQRPDAHTATYVTVQPISWHPEQWDRLLQLLAAQAGPAMLSIGMQPWVVPRQLTEVLRHEAKHYARLAMDTALPGIGLAGAPRLAADPFAVMAAPLYAEAARRYSGQVFRVRITLACTSPPDRALISDALTAFAPPDPAGLKAVSPTGPDLEEAVLLLHGLGVSRQPADAAHLLATLADPAEAAAHCHFPAATTGTSYALPVQQPPPHRHAGGIHVFGDYVHGDKTGGDTIVAGGKHIHLTGPPPSVP